MNKASLRRPTPKEDIMRQYSSTQWIVYSDETGNPLRTSRKHANFDNAIFTEGQGK